MIRIGQKGFPFNIPAVINGDLLYLHPQQLKGRWVALCFVPRLGLIEATVLDHQGKILEEAGGLLLVVPVGTKSLHAFQPAYVDHAHFVILGDPLGRLQRLYGGPIVLPPTRCQTFLIDPNGFFRLYLAHSVNDWGRGVLTEVLRTYQWQEAAALA
jgi:alkyl hydroperoxide reductase subunit AhpC